nr:MAG TPA_asm: hypothetical protein [Caudoviricetes sp.]
MAATAAITSFNAPLGAFFFFIFPAVVPVIPHPE